MKKIKIIFMVVALAIGLQAKSVLKTYTFKDSLNKTIELQTMNAGIYIPTYKNKTILLAFFGKNCPPCLAEIPGFVKLQNELGDKLQIVAMHVQQKMTKAELKNFISMHYINYPVIPATNEVFDLVNFIASKTSWGGRIPFSLLLDKKGKVINTYLGMQSEETLTKAINSIQ
jgi:thiol-disulfide isomerase/thioredoxin